MRVVFFGCDDFAEICLQRVIAEGFSVAALVTRPDRPRGRGLRLEPGPTKTLAAKAGIEVFQPENLRTAATLEHLRSYQADVFVVVAYGHLLPPDVLSLPKFFCVNVHPSLLPKYRGAAPVNWAIMNGDTVTGVSIIRLDPAMDAGAILAQEEYPIPVEMTSAELRVHLAHRGAEMLVLLLPEILLGRVVMKTQEASLVTLAPKMTRELGVINWALPAQQIHNLVRGTQPWPGTHTVFRGHMLKIVQTLPASGSSSIKYQIPGRITSIEKNGFWVQTGDGLLLVQRVHPASSKPMPASAFLSGHKIVLGEQLG